MSQFGQDQLLMRTWRRSAPGAALAFCGALMLGGCGDKSAANANAGAPQAMPVHVQVAKAVPIPDTTEYLSVLKSRHSVMIDPQVEGQITAIHVKSGDRVTAGQVLVQIDPSKQAATLAAQESSLKAQEANVRFAKVSLERAQKLYDAGVVSKHDFDNAQSSYDAAVAQEKALSDQVEQQKVQLGYYKVAAPMSGIVGDVPVHVGDLVTFTTLLTTVDEPGALEAYIYVPADRARNLKMGLPVKLVDDAGKVISNTRITFISPQVDTETQTVLAKATIEKPQGTVRVAQQVRAQVQWGVHEGPVIPILAVTRINGQFFAFLAVNEANGTVARQKLLKVGDTLGNDYTVLDGLKQGDHIITSGTQFLQDGFPVKELPGDSASSGSGEGSTGR